MVSTWWVHHVTRPIPCGLPAMLPRYRPALTRPLRRPRLGQVLLLRETTTDPTPVAQSLTHFKPTLCPLFLFRLVLVLHSVALALAFPFPPSCHDDDDDFVNNKSHSHQPPNSCTHSLIHLLHSTHPPTFFPHPTFHAIQFCIAITCRAPMMPMLRRRR